MAAIGNTTQQTFAADSDGVTFAHPNNSGSYLLVVVGMYGGSAPTCTYNGVAMTLIATQVYATQVHIFGLANPSSGTNNVAVSWAGAAEGQAVAISVLNGTFRSGSNNSATGISNAPSVAITSAVGDLVIDCVAFYCDAGSTLTVGSGQTVINQYSGPAPTDTRFGVSVEDGASSVTMSWSFNNAPYEWAIAGISIMPTSGQQICVM